MINEPDQHQEIRDAVRQLCRQFPDEYFRKIDKEEAYPEAFVDALIEAGWLAAMIPEEQRKIRELLGAAHGAGKYDDAAQIFADLVNNDTFVEFLTLPAYERIE